MPDIERSARLAAAWLLERSRELKAEPLVVLPHSHARTSGPGAIQWLAKRYPVITPRSRGSSDTGRSVLAYAVDYKGFQLAAQCAQGAALVVVEWPTDPLIGWAVESRALNLATGELTPDSRSEETINHLEHLHRSGYNGWTTSFDKQVVPPLLAVMREQGTLDRDLVCGYMLAHGQSAESIKNLAAMMARL